MFRSSIAILLVAVCCPFVVADGEGDNNPESVRRIPKDGVAVPAEREQALRSGLAVLQQKIAAVRQLRKPAATELLPDVMIFERAVRCALDYNEFFSDRDIDKAEQLLEEGVSRAEQLLAGTAEWTQQSGLIVRGYISRIDHTVQPYGLVVPDTYAFSRRVPTRCDIWFHGRGETLSEVNFIWERMKSVGRYAPEDTIVLHPYGRYSNAFKFAGEVDVLEALEDVQNRYRIDEDRISVRGFSMGGAACWQFATHYSDRWFAANPGAGFSETPEFLRTFQNETLHPTAWEKSLWNMYDCDKYALNLVNCPTVAYSGEIDRQKQAADVMERALAEHGIRLRHVIGANTAHTIDDASKATIESAMDALADRGRNTLPARIHLQTHTLKYNRMHWLTVDELTEHWKPAEVTAERKVITTDAANGDVQRQRMVVIATSNVSALSLNFPAGTFLDDVRPASQQQNAHTVWLVSGQTGPAADPVRMEIDGPFSDGSASLQVHLNDQGQWIRGARPTSGLRKRHNLQGPIDDAFMDSFIFVRGTGTAANEATGRWADSELERAIEHWRRHFRGDARVVNDTDVTEQMIASANLVLWGDPSSNSVLAKIADRLPIGWDSDRITVGQQTFDAADHAAALIYPNPLNPDRYVVLNSSFTFRDYAYLNNARQVSMLPDWAIIDLKTAPGYVWPGKVVAADFFDEQWQLKK